AYNLDARNHGDSEWSDEFDFDLNAEDLLHFIDEKNFPKVVIIGHSMGGLTGIKAALKEPERIEMLFVEEKFVKKVPQAFMDDALSYMNVWREAEKFIPPGVDKEDADNFITEYVLRKTRPQNIILKYSRLGRTSAQYKTFRVSSLEKFSGSTLKNSKAAICLRDYGIDVLGKIKFGVKDHPKISDCI
ncbi:hypothetical protein AVEN_183776-1, partial [Araneus ventricosus]